MFLIRTVVAANMCKVTFLPSKLKVASHATYLETTPISCSSFYSQKNVGFCVNYDFLLCTFDGLIYWGFDEPRGTTYSRAS